MEKGIIEQLEDELATQKKKKSGAEEDLTIAKSNVSFSETQISDSDKAIMILNETIKSLKGIF